MGVFKVNKVSIFFSNEIPKEFMQKYFTLMYHIEGNKIIARNYVHNSNSMSHALAIPKRLEINQQEYLRLPTGVPCHTHFAFKTFFQ